MTAAGSRGGWRATAPAIPSRHGDPDRALGNRGLYPVTPAASTDRPPRTPWLQPRRLHDSEAGSPRTADRAGRRRRWGGIALLALLGSVACGHPDRAADASPARPPTAPPSPEGSTWPSPSLQAPLPGSGEPARILADYRRFWAIAVTVSRRPPASWRTTMAAIAVEPLLSELLDGITEQHRKGLVDYGTVVPHPRVVQTSADRASIVDCQDASNSGTVDVKTGIVQNIGSARTPMTSVLTRGADGRWRLSEAELLDGTC